MMQVGDVSNEKVPIGEGMKVPGGGNSKCREGESFPETVEREGLLRVLRC